MKDIIEELKNADLRDYAGIPFWSWNNELEIPELLKQIEAMKKRHLGGFIMHARTGLKTPYLGEKWFACIEACLDKAKELNMRAWVYDENGWPSGFVGGELLKDKKNLATYLTLEEGFDGEAMACFVSKESGFERIRSAEEAKGQKVYAVRLNYSPANTDILNPAVMDQFIAMTYEKYYERFADRFGKEFAGFFTDEPQYYRYATPYSVVLDDEYKALYGEDLRDGLIHLFFDGEADFEFRERYYKLIHGAYVRNYYKRLYDWCEGHGCAFTGHSVEESWLFTQMWGGAGVTETYEFETIPAIDDLADNFSARLSAKQLGSAREQLGKRQALTETFGCSGYDTPPRRLRAIGDGQFVRGVTMMCHHLYSYSLAEQGKYDHPPCFSEHMPWRDDFADFNDYFTHLGYLLSNSDEQVNALVISPLSSVYLKYKRNDEEAARIYDIRLMELQSILKEKGIAYHLADESLLKRHGRAQDGEIVLGRMQYKYVIVPYISNLYASTKKVLEEYASQGGKVCLYDGVSQYTDGKRDDYSFLRQNATLDEIAADGAVKFEASVPVEYTYRKGKNFTMLYLFNESEKVSQITLAEKFTKLDPVTLREEKIDGTLELAPEGSAVLLLGRNAEKSVFAAGKTEDITDRFRFVKIGENNLTLDFVNVSTDGKTFGEPRYFSEVTEDLIRKDYRGKLYVRYTFAVKDKVPVRLMREKDRGAEFLLNGKELSFGQSSFDMLFEEADISDLIREGENEFIYSVDFYQDPGVRFALFDPEATESVRNCLVYDTYIYPVYLRGKFEVDAQRRLAACTHMPSVKGIDKDGYKFFAGDAEYAAEIESQDGGRACLRFTGSYMTVHFTVNGKEYSCALNDCTEVELKKGTNKIALKITASLRNMFGPFHLKANEKDGVSPFSFTMSMSWKDGKSEWFDPAYKTFPFGLEKIECILAEKES